MENQVAIIDLSSKIVLYKEQLVMLDADVAELYGVETKRVNEAVRNNAEKFPPGYVITPTKQELTNLKSKISTSSCGEIEDLRSKNSTAKENNWWKISTASENLKSKLLISSHGGRRKPPTFFTERGLYMLATILKGEIATRATLSIIETYAQVREMQNELISLHNEKDPKMQEKRMNKFGEILSEIVMPDLRTDETETTLEMNFLIGKIKHTVKRRRVNGHDEVEQK